MIKFSSSFKLNEIYTIDRALKRIPKTYFFQGDPNFGEGRPEYLGKMGNNRDIYYYANRGVVNFESAYQALPPGTKIFVMAQFSYMPDQFLRKMKKGQNLTFL